MKSPTRGPARLPIPQTPFESQSSSTDRRPPGSVREFRHWLAAFLFLFWAGATHAAVFQGTLQYEDLNPATGSSRNQPIVGVEVTAVRMSPFPVVTKGTTTTDATGFFRMNFVAAAGELVVVVVKAENSAVVVHDTDLVAGDPFTRQFQRIITSSGVTEDFSHVFTDRASSSAFNIAETLRRGQAFVNARRDPREMDSLGKVHAQPSPSIDLSFFRPGDGLFLENTLMLNAGGLFQDSTLLHEYAHFVEHRIGSFMALPSFHDGCIASADAGRTVVLNSPEHAWMEAFADFFAAAVVRADPDAFQGNLDAGTIPLTTMEERPTCDSLPASVHSDAVEMNVAAVLADLMDGATPGEPWDRVADRVTTIIQIMDHEMDDGLDFPNIHDFRRAWRQRGLPVADLERIVFHDLPGFGFEFNSPGDQTFSFDRTTCEHIVRYTGPTLHGSVAIPSIVCTPPSGSDFPIGTTEVTCVLRDFVEEMDRVSFQVTVDAPTVEATAGSGLRGSYFDTMEFGTPALQRTDGTINFNWGAGAPDPRLGADTFSVRWTGYLVPPYDSTYTFTIRADEAAQLFIGETLVVSQTGHAQVTESSGTIALEAGHPYPIRVDYFENTGDASIQLFYASDCFSKRLVPTDRLFPPVSGSGVAATYFATAADTIPLVTRVDPTVNFSWGARAPVSGIHGTTFHARWTGKVQVDCSGDYHFYTTTAGGSRLSVGGQQLIDALNSNPASEQHGTMRLEQGHLYDLLLEVNEPQGSATAKLLWSGPCTPKSVIDAEHLTPFYDELAHDTVRVGDQWRLAGESYTPGGGPLIPTPLNEFTFVAQPYHGNGEASARLAAHSGLAGLMMRDGWTTASPEVFLGMDASGNGVFWTKGGLGTQRQVRRVDLGPDPAPWIKLSRSGDQVAAEASPDGVNWRVVATETCPCSPTPWFGAAVQGPLRFLPGSTPSAGLARFEGLTLQASAENACCRLTPGLVGAYFDGAALAAPRLRQLDAGINFAWRVPPDPSLNPSAFSVRWTGSMVARSSEAHTFTLRTDGGVRFWLDGRLIVDAWTGGSLADRRGTVTLQAGQAYDVRIEFRKVGANGIIQWLEQTPTRSIRLVTSGNLTPLTPSARDIPGVVNTGVDLAGVALPDNWKDFRYSVQVNQGQVTSPYAARAAGGPPIGPWLGDRVTSAWIAPSVDTQTDAGAVIRYSLSFDLTGLEAGSACLAGRFAADGVTAAIELNGSPVMSTTAPRSDAWTDFVILDGFKTRGNSLTFIVRNEGGGRNPSGLRVELCGKAIPRCSAFDEVTPGEVSNPWLHDGFQFRMESEAGVPWARPEIRSETLLNGTALTGLNFGNRLEIALPQAAYLIRATLVRGATAPTVKTYDANGTELSSAVMSAAERVTQTIDLGGHGISRVVITAPQGEVLLLGFCAYAEPTLTILNITVAGGIAQVTSAAVAGRTYCLQARESWTQPWVDVQCVRATGSEITFADPTPATHTMRMYRVVERP